ncbi:hypothetical protein EV127DRAFT_227511 [Xylaria flabelliformis]|nr:hypothetical protein EV127DRAFT_227511 [Xylaria flabelliformis]
MELKALIVCLSAGPLQAYKPICSPKQTHVASASTAPTQRARRWRGWRAHGNNGGAFRQAGGPAPAPALIWLGDWATERLGEERQTVARPNVTWVLTVIGLP